MGATTLRLLHIADLHLGIQSGGRLDPATGLNRRVVDVCARFDEVCRAAEADHVHAVLFAGDAFNNQHPNPTLQSLFASRVRRLSRSGVAVFLLIGNHDLPKMASLAHPFSIYEALEVEGVVVGDRATVYRLPLRDDAPAPFLQVAALPHFSRHQALARLGDVSDPDVEIERLVAETVRTLGSQIDPELPSVFVGHCHINQAEVGEAHALFGVSDVEVSLSTLTSGQPFPYFALGHVHKRQVLSTEPFVAYPGSLERVDFGEGERVDVTSAGAVTIRAAEPKGFYRADLSGVAPWSLADEPRFSPVHARRFVTLRLDELSERDPASDLDGRITAARANGVDLTDAFLRIAASISAADRGRIGSALARQLVPEAYDVRLVLESRTSAAVRDPRFAEPMSEVTALDRYLETREDWKDDIDELKRLGRDLLAEVLEG